MSLALCADQFLMPRYYTAEMTYDEFKLRELFDAHGYLDINHQNNTIHIFQPRLNITGEYTLEAYFKQIESNLFNFMASGAYMFLYYKINIQYRIYRNKKK
jgi:hypothetical protein